MTPENATRLRAAYADEMRSGKNALKTGEFNKAFRHFERAHILGQRHTVRHVRAHWAMLQAGWLIRDYSEIVGQLTRILGAAVLTKIWIPHGNTGWANVSAFARMPVPADLRELLEHREQ